MNLPGRKDERELRIRDKNKINEEGIMVTNGNGLVRDHIAVGMKSFLGHSSLHIKMVLAWDKMKSL